MMTAPSVRIVGPGRAGRALSIALGEVGWHVLEPVRRGDSTVDAASDVDLVVIATPDSAIAEVASSITPVDSAVVAHLSGARGLEDLVGHVHRAALHPLTSMPSAEVGARRLRRNAWFAVGASDEFARIRAESVVTALSGRSFSITDEQRVRYHAAAAIASNHVVALLGSAERVANQVGLPITAYLELVRATIDNIEDLGIADALTGPVARGDWETVAQHRAAIDESELELYDALVEAAQRVVDSRRTAPDEPTHSP